MDVCELDPELAGVAEKWFGFERSSGKVSLHIEDGTEFVKKTSAANQETDKKPGLVVVHQHIRVGM